MSKPVKIFEIKMDDWLKGLSRQTEIAIGGIFSSMTNFDPFEIAGVMRTPLQSTLASDTAVTNTPTIITPVTISGVSYLFVHTQNKLYQVLDGTPWTTTDKTASVVVTNGVRGAIVYQGRYVYTLAGSVRSNAMALNDDKEIYNGANSDGIWHPMCVGADKKLYVGDRNGINVITNANGTSGNSGNAVTLESNMTVRDILNDGRYLVLLADNNDTGDYNFAGTSPTVPLPIDGKYRCQVLFWDMVKSTFDQIYEFEDSYLVGGKILEGGIHIFGGDNIYVCNIATAPQAIFNFRSPSPITKKPRNPFQITRAKHSIYWCGVTGGGKIYAYGSLFPGMTKIFYQPFSGQDDASCIVFNGSKFYTGSSASGQFLQISDTGSERIGGSVLTAPIYLDRPYKFHHIKVLLQTPMVSGDSVDAYMFSRDLSSDITASNTKSFTSEGAKQVLIFEKNPSANTVDIFEDFQLNLSVDGTTVPVVAKVEVWGIPQDNYSQEL